MPGLTRAFKPPVLLIVAVKDVLTLGAVVAGEVVTPVVLVEDAVFVTPAEAAGDWAGWLASGGKPNSVRR